MAVERDLLHEDQSLVEGIKRSDRETLSLIYREHLPGVLYYVRQNSGSDEEGRDLFQEALVVVFEKARKDELRLTAGLGTYIQAICRNLWLKRLRKKSREGVTSDEDLVLKDELDIEQDVQQSERYQLYREKFARLGEDCQKLLGLFFDKVSLREIAEKMGFSSEGYAKKRKFKCKEQLIRLIENDQRYQELTV